jgi:hypothetical protein
MHTRADLKIISECVRAGQLACAGLHAALSDASQVCRAIAEGACFFVNHLKIDRSEAHCTGEIAGQATEVSCWVASELASGAPQRTATYFSSVDTEGREDSAELYATYGNAVCVCLAIAIGVPAAIKYVTRARNHVAGPMRDDPPSASIAGTRADQVQRPGCASKTNQKHTPR